MRMSAASLDGFLVAYSQLPDEQSGLSDSISMLENECVVLATGVGNPPYAEDASRYTSETALWCYKHVRQRPYYWEDKTKLIHRIFRTSNLSLWQKRKELAYREGLASMLSVILLGVRKIWIGSVGNTGAYFIREGLVEDMTYVSENFQTPKARALGFARSGIVPVTVSETLISGDVLILASDGVSSVITEDDIRFATDITGITQETCMKSAVFLLEKSLERGSRGSKTVCVIKKL